MSEVRLNINGRNVTAEAGETILECAARYDIMIPRLCTHPALSAFGACRLCIVEIEGVRGYPTSCTTPAAEGMKVQTETPALQKLRRNILGLMMLEHPSACLVCSKRELCEAYRPMAEKAGRTTGCHTCSNKEVCEVRSLSEELGFSELTIPPSYHHRPLDRSNPFIDRDLNLCILCGRCVRICKHQHGRAVIDFVQRGSDTHIGQAFDRSLKDAGCTFCGSCIDVCPTGALADRYAKWYPTPDAVTQSTCIFCDQACALELAVKSKKLTSARAVNEKIPICLLGRFAVAEFLNSAERLRMPYVRVGKVLRETEWEDTLKTTAENLKKFVGDGFTFVCDTTSTVEDRHIFKKFTQQVMKSKYFIEIEPNTQGISLSSLPKGTKAVLLTGKFIPSDQLEDLELLIVQDCMQSGVSERADVVLPAAVFAEVEGTTVDAHGRQRPLHKACEPPGQARPEWWIIAELARIMGAKGFDCDSVGEISKELGISGTDLFIERDKAPEAALDISKRRTYFRGHRIDDKVGGLAELPLDEQIVKSRTVSAREEGFEILEKREIAPNVHEIIIKAPEVAAKAQPGQFVIVMVDETSERVPFTLCDWDAEKETITLIVLEVGQSSRKVVLLKAGDKIAHLAGPLGVPLEIKKYGNVLLTGGCYGIGAILRIASALKQAGNHVVGIVEGRSHYKHYYTDKLRAACSELIQTTIDGSLNFKGHSVDVVAQKLKNGEKVNCVIAVGCPFMMMLTAKETQPYGVKTLAALNPIMLDGTGMCGACRLTVGGQMKFACVDGPFFDAHQVDWDEVRDRRIAYSDDEIHVVGRTESVAPKHRHNGGCTHL